MENLGTYDLIVVGGGPAGTAVAITAAGNDARVLLLERGKFPRHKVCGEFVSAESLTLLASLLDSRHLGLLHDAVRIPRARLFVDGRTIETAIDPPAASIARVDLDLALWESAIARGVEAAQQVTVNSVGGTGPFWVSTPSGKYEARALINASGRWSNLNNAPGANGAGHEKWLGVKAHFAEPAPEPSVDLYFFDGGYCGVQPVDSQVGRINASAMVRAEVASTLPEVFAQHPVLLERSRRWRQVSETVSTSPLIFREPEPVRDGILMAGDAAAFVDPFVGDGISLALRSGALAAKSLAEFLHYSGSYGDATTSYQKDYKQRFNSVFRNSSALRRLLKLPQPVRAPLLFAAQNVPGIARYVVNRTR